MKTLYKNTFHIQKLKNNLKMKKVNLKIRNYNKT